MSRTARRLAELEQDAPAEQAWDAATIAAFEAAYADSPEYPVVATIDDIWATSSKLAACWYITWRRSLANA